MSLIKYLSLTNLIITLFLTNYALANNQSIIYLKAGEIHLLPIENIARVAVGDGKVLNAVTDDDKEVVLFAREEGQTGLQVWDTNGKSYAYQIVVNSANTLRLQEDIRRTLNKIDNVKASLVGDKVIVEGDKLSDSDREKVNLLATHYPQIIDLTSQIGWDQMVMLDVQILEVPRNFLQEIGVKWQGSSEGGISTGLLWDRYHKPLLERPGEMALQVAMGIRQPVGYFGLNALFSSTLQAMVHEGRAVMLAQPQLMARSGATAEFLAGGEVPYTVTDQNGSAQTQFKPYGVSLVITPRIEKNGIIRSNINVEVSSIDPSLNLEGGPAFKIRRTATEFNVKSGETLVLSGFISRDQVENLDKVPGVGDVPILSNLYRSKKFQNNETELAIFVSPHVISTDNEAMQKRVLRSQAIIDSSFEQKPLLNVQLKTKVDGFPEQYIQASRSNKFSAPLVSADLRIADSIWRPVLDFSQKIDITKQLYYLNGDKYGN